jgi:fucose permease
MLNREGAIATKTREEEKLQENGANSEERFSRDAYTWYLYLILAIFGYKQSILGSIAPFLRDEMGLSKVDIGWHFSIYAVGLFLSGRVVQVAQKYLSGSTVLVVSALLMTMAILCFIVPLPMTGTLAVAFALGLAGGALQVSVQAEIARHHGKNRGVALTEAYVLAGLGVFAGPLVIGIAAAAGFGWRDTLFVPAILLTVVLIAFRNVKPVERIGQGAGHDARDSLNLPIAVVAVLGMILLGIATEWGVGFWGAQFLEIRLGVGPERGVTLMAAFFGGTVIGRLVASRLLRRFTVHHLLIFAIVMGGLVVSILWGVPLLATALPALVVAGMCLGNFFPLILSIANEYAPTQPARVSSGSTQAVGIALLVVPIFLGRLGTTIGLENAVGLLAFLPIAMLLLYAISIRLKGSRLA